jgi:uncharacterized membrane protein YdjX (TVP38/TMEM64 family)
MKKIAIPFLISVSLIVIVFLLFHDIETIFTNQLQRLSKHTGAYSIVSFLVLTSDIVLPVPSSIVMYTNGFVLGLISGSAISLLSVIASSIIGYYLGSLTSAGIKAKSNDASNYILLKYGTLAILISRGIPIISESICIVCGYNRMPFKNYLVLNFIGYIPLCFLYALFGSIGYDKNTFLISFVCSIILSGGFWFFGKRLLKNKKNNPDSVTLN